jgi:hypothetical protein
MLPFWSNSSPESFLADARSVVHDKNATLASPIETITINEARKRFHVVSFDFRSDERAFALKLSPSNEGFTTVHNGFAMTPDGIPITYTTVTAIFAERDRTLLAVHKSNPQLEANGDAKVDTRISSGSRMGTTNDPTLRASLKSLATYVVMERNELSLGDTYRVMGWTEGPATVEMRILNRDEITQGTPDLARTSLVASASSDGMFVMEGVIASEYPGEDRMRRLNESDYCQLPFVVNGKLASVHSLTVRSKDQIGQPPQPMPSSTP